MQEKLSERITYLESQARTNKEETQTEVVAMLKTLDAKLTEISTTGHLRTRPRTGESRYRKIKLPLFFLPPPPGYATGIKDTFSGQKLIGENIASPPLAK